LERKKIERGQVKDERLEEKQPSVRFQCCTKLVSAIHGPQGVYTDAEGFLACPEHGQRRYGWRSPRTKFFRVHPFNPAKPQYIERPLWGESDIERDKIIQRNLFPQLTDEVILAKSLNAIEDAFTIDPTVVPGHILNDA
jgi:hypothetical protein